MKHFAQSLTQNALPAKVAAGKLPTSIEIKKNKIETQLLQPLFTVRSSCLVHVIHALKSKTKFTSRRSNKMG